MTQMSTNKSGNYQSQLQQLTAAQPGTKGKEYGYSHGQQGQQGSYSNTSQGYSNTSQGAYSNTSQGGQGYGNQQQNYSAHQRGGHGAEGYGGQQYGSQQGGYAGAKQQYGQQQPQQGPSGGGYNYQQGGSNQQQLGQYPQGGYSPAGAKDQYGQKGAYNNTGYYAPPKMPQMYASQGAVGSDVSIMQPGGIQTQGSAVQTSTSLGSPTMGGGTQNPSYSSTNTGMQAQQMMMMGAYGFVPAPYDMSPYPGAYPAVPYYAMPAPAPSVTSTAVTMAPPTMPPPKQILNNQNVNSNQSSGNHSSNSAQQISTTARIDQQIQNLDKNKRWNGTVKTYNIASGFGFITCPDTHAIFERDVFFNRSITGTDKIEPGMLVTFQVMVTEKKQPQAVEIRLAENQKKPTQIPADKEFFGVIRTYNKNLGYGFISCSDIKEMADRDVFVHKQQFEGLEIGDQVSFKVIMNAKGQPQARDVEKADNDQFEQKVDPPEGKERFTGRLRGFNKENDFTFLDSEDASKKFGQTDVFLHRIHCPKDVDMSAGGPELFFEFDVVMVKTRPQARNLKIVQSKTEENPSPVKVPLS